MAGTANDLLGFLRPDSSANNPSIFHILVGAGSFGLRACAFIGFPVQAASAPV
jgi:hypothetical protein